MKEFKEHNKLKNGIILIIVFFLGVGAMYALVHFYPTLISKEITKVEKNVTVNDSGIADAVDKV